MAKCGCLSKTRISGNAFGQPHAMGDGDVLEQLLCAFVRVEQTYLEIKHRFPSYAEQEMPRFNDPGMDRANRHVKNALAFHFTEFVPLALEWRQFALQTKVFAQWVHFRPIIVQCAPARI